MDKLRLARAGPTRGELFVQSVFVPGRQLAPRRPRRRGFKSSFSCRFLDGGRISVRPNGARPGPQAPYDPPSPKEVRRSEPGQASFGKSRIAAFQAIPVSARPTMGGRYRGPAPPLARSFKAAVAEGPRAASFSPDGQGRWRSSTKPSGSSPLAPRRVSHPPFRIHWGGYGFMEESADRRAPPCSSISFFFIS